MDVMIISYSDPALSANCTHGEARLIGELNDVELCLNNQWTTVCYRDDWRLPSIICKQNGFSELGEFHLHCKNNKLKVFPNIII